MSGSQTAQSSATVLGLKDAYSNITPQGSADDQQRTERDGEHDCDNDNSKPAAHPLAFLAPPTDSNMVTWNGPDDAANPQNMPYWRKWVITCVCVLMTVNVSFASSAPTPASQHIQEEFGVNAETTYAIVTVFLVGFVFGPILWGPGSELLGRRVVVVCAMACYTLFHIGQALAKNIETLMICRFFSGFFGVAPLTIAGGIIADVWPAVDRGPPVSLFSASVFMGPVLGPIVGSFIAYNDVSWRWVYWVMMMFAGVCTVLSALLLPETYAPVLLAKKLRRLKKEDPEKNKDLFADHERQDWTFRGLIYRTLYRPFQMLLLEPILVLVTIYLSVVYGILYALFEAIPIIFMETRGFSLWQNGLIFIGVGIGTAIGGIITLLTGLHYPTLVPKWKGFPPPEQRLFGAMIGAPCLVIGAFWLGWSGHYSNVHWIVPALSTIFVGASICLIFTSFLSYLVDTYLMYAASAFAANTVIRSLVAGAFPLFTVQMYHNLGINWASTLIGLIGLVLAPLPFLFYRFGPNVRSRSKFAPCADLKIATFLEAEAQKEKATA